MAIGGLLDMLLCTEGTSATSQSLLGNQAGAGTGGGIVRIETSGLAVVFLDAAGTLFEVRGSVGEIYSTIARRYGADISPRELEEAFTATFRRKSLEGIQSGEAEDRIVREKQWWLEVVEEVFAGRMPALALKLYFQELFEVFRTGNGWRLFPDTFSSLERLRDAGYRLGIISNFDSRLRDLLVDLGIGMFEHVTISWEVGAAKPDPRIYRCALEAMNVPPARAVHIGDSILEDVAGARGAGLETMLLDRRNIHPEWAGGRRIRSLTELCEILPVKATK